MTHLSGERGPTRASPLTALVGRWAPERRGENTLAQGIPGETPGLPAQMRVA